MIHIDRTATEVEIEALTPEWRALWRRIPTATPFQSPEWLLSWWSCFGSAAPLVLAAHEDDRLIGLLPLYVCDEPGCRKLLPFGISLSDYLDALIDPGYPKLGNTLLEGRRAGGLCRSHREGFSFECGSTAERCRHAPPVLAEDWEFAGSGILRFSAKETAYAYLSGFDPDCAELCPGAQIIAYAIEEAVREGIREFHSLRGGEAYKYSWGAVDRPNITRTLRLRC
jgi:CelD/BcsL family acetyltransferase involved in cellulose biosynthesis